jgi:hypothetical protein
MRWLLLVALVVVPAAGSALQVPWWQCNHEANTEQGANLGGLNVTCVPRWADKAVNSAASFTQTFLVDYTIQIYNTQKALTRNVGDYLIVSTQKSKEVFLTAWGLIGDAFDWFWNALKWIWQKCFVDFANWLVEAAETIWKKVFVAGVEFFVDTTKTVWQKCVVNVAKWLVKAVKTFWDDAFMAMLNWFVEAFKTIGKAGVDAAKWMIKAFKTVWNDGVKVMWEWFKGAVKTIWQKCVVDLGNWGIKTIKTFWEWFKGAWEWFKGAVKTIWQKCVVDFANWGWKQFKAAWKYFGKAWEWFKGAVKTIWKKCVVDFANWGWKQFKAVWNYAGEVWEWYKKTVRMIWQKVIVDTFNWATNFVKTTWEKCFNQLNAYMATAHNALWEDGAKSFVWEKWMLQWGNWYWNEVEFCNWACLLVWLFGCGVALCAFAVFSGNAPLTYLSGVMMVVGGIGGISTVVFFAIALILWAGILLSYVPVALAYALAIVVLCVVTVILASVLTIALVIIFIVIVIAFALLFVVLGLITIIVLFLCSILFAAVFVVTMIVIAIFFLLFSAAFLLAMVLALVCVVIFAAIFVVIVIVIAIFCALFFVAFLLAMALGLVGVVIFVFVFLVIMAVIVLLFVVMAIAILLSIAVVVVVSVVVFVVTSAVLLVVMVILFVVMAVVMLAALVTVVALCLIGFIIMVVIFLLVFAIFLVVAVVLIAAILLILVVSALALAAIAVIGFVLLFVLLVAMCVICLIFAIIVVFGGGALYVAVMAALGIGGVGCVGTVLAVGAGTLFVCVLFLLLVIGLLSTAIGIFTARCGCGVLWLITLLGKCRVDEGLESVLPKRCEPKKRVAAPNKTYWSSAITGMVASLIEIIIVLPLAYLWQITISVANVSIVVRDSDVCGAAINNTDTSNGMDSVWKAFDIDPVPLFGAQSQFHGLIPYRKVVFFDDVYQGLNEASIYISNFFVLNWECPGTSTLFFTLVWAGIVFVIPVVISTHFFVKLWATTELSIEEARSQMVVDKSGGSCRFSNYKFALLQIILKIVQLAAESLLRVLILLVTSITVVQYRMATQLKTCNDGDRIHLWLAFVLTVSMALYVVMEMVRLLNGAKTSWMQANVRSLRRWLKLSDKWQCWIFGSVQRTLSLTMEEKVLNTSVVVMTDLYLKEDGRPKKPTSYELQKLNRKPAKLFLNRGESELSRLPCNTCFFNHLQSPLTTFCHLLSPSVKIASVGEKDSEKSSEKDSKKGSEKDFSETQERGLVKYKFKVHHPTNPTHVGAPDGKVKTLGFWREVTAPIAGEKSWWKQEGV